MVNDEPVKTKGVSGLFPVNKDFEIQYVFNYKGGLHNLMESLNRTFSLSIE